MRTFFVDNSDTGGSFGSIAFSIDMGNNNPVAGGGGDIFGWIGTTAADTVKVTDSSFEANGGKGTLIGTEFQRVRPPGRERHVRRLGCLGHAAPG